MKTCPKCQSQVSENSRFCTNCGASFQGGETREAKGPKVSRTKWYVIGGSGIVLGGILFFSGQAAAVKEKVLDSFLEAVAERDQTAVKKALVSNHPEQDVDDEHVEAFFDVLDNSSEAHGELIQKDVFDRGIRQRFSGAEATNVTLNDDDSYTVETREEYEIRPKDGECTKRTFEASYKVVYDEEDETWRISELIETNEVD